MKTQVQTQKQESHTIQSKTKANRQAPVAEVLQRYKERTVQRESLEDEELLQGKFEGSRNEEGGSRNDDVSSLQQVAQREALPDEEELVQGKFESIQQQKSEENSSLLAPRSSFNNTGLPDKLKTDVENLSGYSMDDVRVHYNSPKPAQLQALAYTQGTDIHVGPGQEKHLPHEAWHVVQQKQGRVQPTMQLRGVNVNDNEGLEKEADMMPSRTQFVAFPPMAPINANIIQMAPDLGELAARRFENRVRWRFPESDGKDTAEICHSAINNYWEELGLTEGLLSQINLIPLAQSYLNYMESVKSKVKGYYKEIADREKIGVDLNGEHAFKEELGDPKIKGTVLNTLSEALLSTLFPPEGKDDKHYIFKDEERTQYTTPLAHNNPRDIQESALSSKEKGGHRLFNSIVTKKLPAVHIRRDATGLLTLALYENNTVHLKKGSSRQDIIHELGHHLETHLGLHDFIKIHRFLRARTRIKSNQQEEGMTRVGLPFKDSMGYSAYMPDLHLARKPELLSTAKTINSKSHKYATLMYEHGDKYGDTEYVSTTVELFTHAKEARKLIEHDPLRAAFLLKIANQEVYDNVRTTFEVFLDPSYKGKELDKLIHFDD